MKKVFLFALLVVFIFTIAGCSGAKPAAVQHVPEYQVKEHVTTAKIGSTLFAETTIPDFTEEKALAVIKDYATKNKSKADMIRIRVFSDKSGGNEGILINKSIMAAATPIKDKNMPIPSLWVSGGNDFKQVK